MSHKDFERKELGEEGPRNDTDATNEEHEPDKFIGFLKKNFIMLIMIFLVVYLFAINSSLKDEHSKDTAIKDMEISTLKETVIEKSQNSEIELFGVLADESKKEAIELLLEINNNYDEIKRLEKEYEKSLLRKSCYKSQIDRMIEGNEYSEEFCDEDQNLESFRKK